MALASTEGGMILSGPKACRGSIKEVRILPHFLHSAVAGSASVAMSGFWTRGRGETSGCASGRRMDRDALLTRHRRRQGIVEAHGEGVRGRIRG